MNHSLLNAFRHGVDRLRGRRHVHLLHVGKTGGTAVKAALEHHASPALQIHLHRHSTTLADVPVGEPFFFFVRDPLQRFASGFYSRQRQGQPRYFYPWTDAEQAAFERFDSPGALGEALSSPDCEAAIRAMTSIRHVRDGYATWFVDEGHLESRRDDLVFVGSQEHLGEDFERLKTVLQLPDALALPDDPTRAHRRPASMSGPLSETAESNLRAWYEPDYRFLDSLADRFDHLPRYR